MKCTGDVITGEEDYERIGATSYFPSPSLPTPAALQVLGKLVRYLVL